MPPFGLLPFPAQLFLLQQTHSHLNLLILKPNFELILLNAHHLQLALGFPLLFFPLLQLLASPFLLSGFLRSPPLITDLSPDLLVLLFEVGLDESWFELDEEEIVMAQDVELHFLLFVYYSERDWRLVPIYLQFYAVCVEVKPAAFITLEDSFESHLEH